MKKVFVLFAIAATMFAACTREAVPQEEDVIEDGVLDDDVQKPAPVKTILTIGSDATKTTIGDLIDGGRQLYWADGDKVCANGVVSDPLTGITPNTVTKTAFSFSPTVSAPYNAVYPANIWKSTSTVSLPQSVTSQVIPLGGTSSDDNISLGALTSALHLKLKLKADEPDTDNIALIQITAASTRLSGDFSINFNTGEITPAASPTTEDKKILLTGDWALSDTPTDFFIPIPAGSHAITVKIMDRNGDYMEKSTSKTFVKGQILNLAALEFDPSSTDSKVYWIDDADDLVAFATKFNTEDAEVTTYNAFLTADIIFDASSSAAFNATGGFGLNTDRAYGSTFDGAGHTISGLDATVPLFAYVGGNGTSLIKNLTIDETCSFTFTHAKTTESYFGAIAGYCKGKLNNVKVAANVSLAAVADVTGITSLGGLIGRVRPNSGTGALSNCEYSGLITTPSGFSTNTYIYIGGIVGKFDNNEAGSITKSTFKGAISHNALCTANNHSQTAPRVFIGGIAGLVDGGTTLSNTNTTSDHSTVNGAYGGSSGIIVNNTTQAYISAMGGIAGQVVSGTITQSQNAATLLNTIVKKDNNGGTSGWGRRASIGGIVGINGGSVSNSVNEGSITTHSDVFFQYLGGIVGRNGGTVSSCTNNAPITINTADAGSNSARYAMAGGVLGENTSTSVSDVKNQGNLEISSIEDNTSTYVRMGGVIGENTAAIDGGSATKNISNSGRVYFNTNNTTLAAAYNLGGVVGYSAASVQNAKNSGYVLVNWNSNTNVASKFYLGGIIGMMAGNGTISGCQNVGGESNAGEVYLNVKAGSAGHTDNYIGGILGKTEGNVTISDCTNSGYVHGGNTTAVNDKTCFTGGIVAYIAGTSSIEDCDNSGNVGNNQRNNTDSETASTYNGGIVGYVKGTSEHPITIGGTKGCNVTASAMFSRRGWLGGVVGYAEYMTLSNSSFNKNVTLDCLARWLGGIVGWAKNSTITSCDYSGTNLSATQIRTNGAGGIAAKLEASTVNGCSSTVATMICHWSSTDEPVDGGAIVGISGDGNTIKSCHYHGTINGSAAKIAGTGTFEEPVGYENSADL